MSGRTGRRWSDQEILDALVTWAEREGRPPTWTDWEKSTQDHPTAYTVSMRCGSWTQALEIVGLGPPEPSTLRKKKRKPRPERKPRNAAERRERAIEALAQALEKENTWQR